MRNIANDTRTNRVPNEINKLKRQVRGLRADTALKSWVLPTFLNSWVNYGAPYADAGYLLDSNDYVHLHGVVKSGTMGVAIFTLPAGYRPTASVTMAVASNAAFGYITINSSGDVIASGGNNTWYSLDGVIFPIF